MLRSSGHGGSNVVDAAETKAQAAQGLHGADRRSGGTSSLLLGRLFAVASRHSGAENKNKRTEAPQRSQSAARISGSNNTASLGAKSSAALGGPARGASSDAGRLLGYGSSGSTVSRQVRVDGETIVPEDIYRNMMRAGSEARARGQHVIQDSRRHAGRSSENSTKEQRAPRLVRLRDEVSDGTSSGSRS